MSAFEFWRSAASLSVRLESGSTYEPVMGANASRVINAETVRDVLNHTFLVDRGILQEPFHVITRKRVHKRKPGVCFHGFATAPSLRACFHVTNDVFVVSPEICFFQIATQLDLTNLVMAGFELCGSYAYPIQAGDRFISRKPATTPKALKRFVRANSSSSGSGNALRALRFIIPNAASPTEAVLAQFLTLPYLQGGYNFKKPIINRKISLSEKAKRLTPRSCFIADLYWPESKLDVEYDGEEDHSSRKARGNDAERENILDTMGINVLRVTWEQLSSRTRMDSVATAIAKRIGARIRPRSEAFAIRQIMLHTKLLHYIRTKDFDQPGLRD